MADGAVAPAPASIEPGAGSGAVARQRGGAEGSSHRGDGEPRVAPLSVASAGSGLSERSRAVQDLPGAAASSPAGSSPPCPPPPCPPPPSARVRDGLRAELAPRPVERAVRDATADLLWAACRPEPDVEVARRAARRADPDLAAAAAVAHGVAGLLRRALPRAGLPAGWEQASRRIDTVAQVQTMQEVLVLPQAVALALSPLCRAGLEPVVVKGAALVQRYPERGLRPMVDIDLLLPAADHGRALQTLAGAGWRRLPQPGGGRYDAVLTHPAVPALVLELHHGLQGWHERANRLDAKELWRRRRPGRCLGQPAWVLAPEEEMLLLAAHAGKPFHGFSRLIWLTDLAVVVATAGSRLDWDRVAALARRSRTVSVLAVALAMAGRLGLQAPAELVELPTRGWRRAALLPLLVPDWPLRFVGADPAPVPFHLRFALADTSWRRLVLSAGGCYGRSRSQQLVWPVLALGRSARRWHRLRSRR